MTQRVSKLDAHHTQNYEKASQEDIEYIARAFEKRSKFCPSMEVLAVIPIILLSSVSVAVIPGFVPTGIYPNATMREQPLCAPLDHEALGVAKFSVPLIQGLLTYYLNRMGGDVMACAMVGMLFSFDEPSMSLLFQSMSVAILVILILLAYTIVHRILSVDVYGWRWFLNLLIAAALCGTAVFIRPECMGSVVAVIVTTMISGFSDVAAARGSRPVMLWRTGKLILIGYLIAIPTGFLVVMARRSFGGPRLVTEKILWAEAARQIYEHESGILWLFILGAFLLIKLPRYRYVKVVPMISVIAATVATIFLPLESPGNATGIRLLFVRLNLLIGAGVIVTNITQDWLKFGLPLTTFSILAAIKIFRVVTGVRDGKISFD